MRRSLIVLLVIAALAPTSAAAAEWYRCSMDGAARHACCCGDRDRDDEPAQHDPSLRASSCCDVERTAARSADARSMPLDTSAVSALIVPRAALADAPLPQVALAARAPDATAQPRGPPSLYLRNCALLI